MDLIKQCHLISWGSVLGFIIFKNTEAEVVSGNIQSPEVRKSSVLLAL